MPQITVEISEQVKEIMEIYHQVVNQPVNMQVREAIEEYAECTLRTRLEAIQGTGRTDNVIQFPLQ